MTTMRSNLANDWVNSLRRFTSTLVCFVVGALSSVCPFWQLVLVSNCLYGKGGHTFLHGMESIFNVALVRNEQ